MKKSFGLALMAYCALVVAGTAALTSLDRQDAGRTVAVLPEGYSHPAPTAREASSAASAPFRCEDLEVAENVYKYLDRSLEIVAMAPGAGWIKFRTDDGISPLISLDRVDHRSVNQFNAFSESIDEPIRVRLNGKRLEVFAAETQTHLARFDGKTPVQTRRITFFRPESAPGEMALHRNEKGRIFLVKTQSDPLIESGDAIAAVKR